MATRKERALELHKRVSRGPFFSFDTFGSQTVKGAAMLTLEQRREIQAEFEASYQRWVESWVLTDLCQLVPELQKEGKL